VAKKIALTGNHAVAYAMKQINPDVVAAYPITPQTSMMQKFADFYADGNVDTELILVESEHSAMSAAVGASAAGARAMTATAANGLALMWEIVYIASGTRLPIVMPVVNRALSGPINIHCDHSDTMGARDSGWIQIFSENSQEAYENMIQAHRIAEDPDVLLPVMVTLDGFIISHAMETVTLFDDKKVKDFVGEYKPAQSLLDTKNPVTYGPLDLFDYYFEHKRQQAEGMRNAAGVIRKVGQAFKKEFGADRPYDFSLDMVESYKLDDAELAIVVLGSTAGTAKHLVDVMRAEGKKVGLLKIRVFRPFPEEEVAQALSKLKAVAVMDRSDGFNAIGGPLFQDVRAALYRKTDVPVVNYIYGLGGRDIGVELISQVYADLEKIASSGKVDKLVSYLGVR